ncbi:glycosyltransferase [uncultured Aquimarina sp.]|uniref:glycosyltransferase n=1 Tax=uncultured Aquimarina sp. TaxID=575652 RepID=UPI002612A4E3|nr:glycosyltransferase [uncultured Aquimarina sp.]
MKLKTEQPIKIGIDASNIGGGGGITHLKEILEAYDTDFFEKEISEIIVFGSSRTLNQLPALNILTKITFDELNGGIFKRILFQIKGYDRCIRKSNIDILLSLTGDYIGGFKPLVSMSRNMLLYDRKIWKEIKSIKEVSRFWLNYKKQKICFSNSKGILFISKYADSVIRAKLNLENKEISTIHHGISKMFEVSPKLQNEISDYSFSNPYKLLYVSTVHVYKHQWNLVKAIGILRSKGYPVVLDLVGGVIFKPAGELLNRTIDEVDKDRKFINYVGSIEYNRIQEFYQKTDGIVFASTCENMPNILLESMASGSPIACSDKEPMPEFLKENGFYFNSYEVESIVASIEKMLLDQKMRTLTIEKNLLEIKKYSWEKTSKLTFGSLIKNYKSMKNV